MEGKYEMCKNKIYEYRCIMYHVQVSYMSCRTRYGRRICIEHVGYNHDTKRYHVPSAPPCRRTDLHGSLDPHSHHFYRT